MPDYKVKLETAGMNTNKEKVAYLNSIGFTSSRGGRLTEQGYGRTLKKSSSTTPSSDMKQAS